MPRTLALFVAIFAFAPLAAQITPQPPAYAAMSTLSPGQTLANGLWLTSSNDLYHALVRNDGSICTYPGPDPEHAQGAATWCSDATAATGLYYAEVKPNGKFCLYPGQPGGGAQPTWCAGAIAPAGQAGFLIMNGDGNLILNAGTIDRPAGPYWQSGVVYSSVAVTPPLYGAIRWSDDASAPCPPRCERNFLVGSVISLHAAPPNGGTFREWTGGRCVDAANVNPCVLRVAAYVPSVPPVGARNSSSAYRIVNPGKQGFPAVTLWYGPDGSGQYLFASASPASEPASFFVMDGDTVRPASNQNLCWTFHPRSYSMLLRACGFQRPDEIQTGWIYRKDDRTIRNTNSPGSCLYFNSDSRSLMVPGVCFADDPRADSWVNRWNLVQ